MGDRIPKTSSRSAQTCAKVLSEPLFQLLDTGLRPIGLRLWVLLIQALGHALLTRNSAFKLVIQREIHALTQAFPYGLRARKSQLWMLLLQPMVQLRKAPGAIGQ